MLVAMLSLPAFAQEVPEIECKPFDNQTGLSYMGARYYDPVIGRFMGVDPVGFQENNIHSFNRYAYANNNPYKFVDPSGKYAELAIEVASLTMGYMSFRDNIRTGNTMAAITDGVGMVADVVGAALPGVPGFAGLGIKAYREAGEKILYRRGSIDSKKLLTDQAKLAEEKIGIHGVSTSTSAAAKEGQAVRCATCKSVEDAGFKVTQTGKDPNHYTVELPKPITSEVARTWNDLFK